MPPSIFDLSSNVAYLIFEMAWKSTLILGGVVLLGKLLKRQSASVRQTLFSTGILTMLAFLLIAPIFPRWKVFTPNWLPGFDSKEVAVSAAPQLAAANSGATETVSENVSSADDILTAPTYENEASEIDFIVAAAVAVAFVWLTIAVLLFARLLTNLRGLRRLRLNSVVESNADLNFLAQDNAGKFGCRGHIILRNETIEMPLTWGVFRHVVILPKDFGKLPAASRRAILTHELTHVERSDFAVRTLSEILCALLWFQPLAWTLRRRLREEQERVADDRVLASGAAKASAYAKLLLEWQNRLSNENPQSVAAGMIGRGGLERRVDAILDPHLKRRPATTSQVLTAWLVMLSLAIPLGGLIFSREIISAETLSVKNFSESRTSFQIFNDSPNERQVVSQNRRVEALPKTTIAEKSPVREVAAAASSDAKKPKSANNTKGIMPVNEVESKREFKKTAHRFETNSSPVAPLEPTNSTNAADILQPERNKKDAVSSGDQPAPKKLSQVKQVFENIRRGFKNGAKPINIFDQ